MIVDNEGRRYPAEDYPEDWVSEPEAGDLLPAQDGGYVRVINPDWPSGDEPFCERVDEDEVIDLGHVFFHFDKEDENE